MKLNEAPPGNRPVTHATQESLHTHSVQISSKSNLYLRWNDSPETTHTHGTECAAECVNVVTQRSTETAWLHIDHAGLRLVPGCFSKPLR